MADCPWSHPWSIERQSEPIQWWRLVERAPRDWWDRHTQLWQCQQCQSDGCNRNQKLQSQ